MFKEGDIVEIPLPDERIAIGWVIHISQRFKNLVGFLVCGIKGEIRDDVEYCIETQKLSSIPVLGPLYTSIAALKHYEWKTYSHQPISDRHKELTKRRVAEGVYIGDEYIGTVDEIDGACNLKPMLAMGMPVVYDEISKAFPPILNNASEFD